MTESLNNLMTQLTVFREREFCIVAAIALLLSIRGMTDLLQFRQAPAEAVVEMPPLPSSGYQTVGTADGFPVADVSAYNPFQASFAITPPVVVVKKTPPPPPKKVEPKKEPPKRKVSLSFRGMRSSLKGDVSYANIDIQDSVKGNSVVWLPVHYSYQGIFSITDISPDAITIRDAEDRPYTIPFKGTASFTLAR